MHVHLYKEDVAAHAYIQSTYPRSLSSRNLRGAFLSHFCVLCTEEFFSISADTADRTKKAWKHSNLFRFRVSRHRTSSTMTKLGHFLVPGSPFVQVSSSQITCWYFVSLLGENNSTARSLHYSLQQTKLSTFFLSFFNGCREASCYVKNKRMSKAMDQKKKYEHEYRNTTNLMKIFKM
jgi:hypothetical protein